MEYSVRENNISNISHLLQALETLKKYYEKRRDCYESDYSLFLLGLSYYIIQKYESEPEWFGDNGEEVNVILTEIFEMVKVLDKMPNKYTKNTIDFISIYVYRFKEYCEQSE